MLTELVRRQKEKGELKGKPLMVLSTASTSISTGGKAAEPREHGQESGASCDTGHSAPPGTLPDSSDAIPSQSDSSGPPGPLATVLCILSSCICGL